jgi:putative ABC transport system permease protein
VTILTVAWRYLQGRRVASALTVLSIALGVSLVVATTLVTRGIRAGFIEGTTDYSLVVGAKGSPTQLVLNVVFRMDTPTPNISMNTFEELRDDPLVEVAVPVIMGDAFEGFRYVATARAYFADFPWRRRTVAVASGRFFREDSAREPAYEAVLGAEAARRTGLRVGDRFYEGEEMAEYPLTVVGVLSPTAGADDRTIFLSLPSFWQMNEVSRGMDVKPLTAVLVRPKRLSDLPFLHRRLNLSADTQAVFPSAVLLSVFNVLGLVEDGLAVVVAIVAVVVLLYLFVSMYSATFERRREIATMRALGARRATVLAVVLLESAALAVVGGVAGIVGGHGAAYVGASLLAARGGPQTPPFAVGALQPLMLAAVIVLGALAGLLPALLAYRTEVAENLAPLS